MLTFFFNRLTPSGALDRHLSLPGGPTGLSRFCRWGYVRPCPCIQDVDPPSHIGSSSCRGSFSYSLRLAAGLNNLQRQQR